MKYITPVLFALAVSSNIAIAKDNFEVSGDVKANAQTKLLQAQAALAYKNKQNTINAAGTFAQQGSAHAEGASIGYSRTSKSGKSKFRVGAGMSDFNNRDSFSASAGFSFKF